MLSFLNILWSCDHHFLEQLIVRLHEVYTSANCCRFRKKWIHAKNPILKTYNHFGVYTEQKM